ncbi:MAG: SulP family sulfate permease [Oleispira sp.]
MNPNQEAIALGIANLSAGCSSAFPVSASLSRSAVSFNAGAKTPAASALTAISIFLFCVFLTPYLYYLPIVTLAAMILLAVISLFDLAAIKRTLAYSLKDFSALIITFTLTLTQGLEWGLIAGIVVSIALHLYRSSSPHVALLGQVPNTEHFRNIERHNVITDETILSVRIDASLYFANARFLADKINQLVAQSPNAKHLILNCSAINDIDASAVESLLAVNLYLKEAKINFHLSEVKGPVMDRLMRSEFINTLTGTIYLSHQQAWSDLVIKQE